MMTIVRPTAFACRRCGEAVPAGPVPHAEDGTSRVLLDRRCAACGHRALYRFAQSLEQPAAVAASQ